MFQSPANPNIYTNYKHTSCTLVFSTVYIGTRNHVFLVGVRNRAADERLGSPRSTFYRARLFCSGQGLHGILSLLHVKTRLLFAKMCVLCRNRHLLHRNRCLLHRNIRLLHRNRHLCRNRHGTTPRIRPFFIQGRN